MTASDTLPTTEQLADTDTAIRRATTPTTTNSDPGDLTSTVFDGMTTDFASTAAGGALEDNRKNRFTHWHPAVPSTPAAVPPAAERGLAC
jgi:hypothetical protein